MRVPSSRGARSGRCAYEAHALTPVSDEGSAGAAIPASPRGSVAVEEQATTVRTARVVVRRGEVDCGVGGAYTRCRVDLARRPGGYGPPGRAAFTGYLAIIGAGTHRELLSGGLAACRSIRSLIAL